jgi:hypothetical protein
MALHFADPTFLYWWSATDGDVVFWKVPVEFYEKHRRKIDDAFAADSFGYEWGQLSSHSIRTLDLETLTEIDKNCEMVEEP